MTKRVVAAPMEPSKAAVSKFVKIRPAVLPLASVRLRVNEKVTAPVRVLCDTGAQMNSITERLVAKAGLAVHRCRVQITAFGASKSYLTRCVVADVLRRDGEEVLSRCTFVVTTDILDQLQPSQSVASEIAQFPATVTEHLAEPELDRPDEVQVLLGAGTMAQITIQQAFRQANGWLAQASTLGWIVYGGETERIAEKAQIAVCQLCEPEVNALLRTFWTERGEQTTRATVQEERCESIFQETHHRQPDGRYVVSLPFVTEPPALGASREIALRRYHQLEKRLQRDPELGQKYTAAIDDFIQLGHLKLAERPPEEHHYYIPHHCVTRKFRVVFDASCASSNGRSLNDVQMVGAKLQDDLFNLLLRFRTHPYAMTADIKQMYRQIGVAAKHWDYQRIFWRPKDAAEPLEYWLTVVTFGVASAPHCAVRALQQCAQDNGQQYPKAQRAIMSDFYMDDLLTGASTREELTEQKAQIIEILAAGGFDATKWQTNAGRHPAEPPNEESSLPMDETSVLGLKWTPGDDKLRYKINAERFTFKGKPTRRRILSSVARLFDPIGLLGPVTLRGKHIVQQSWSEKAGWDEAVGAKLSEQWQRLQEQLPCLESVAVPRWLGTANDGEKQLHIFADASAIAYGAVIYLRMTASDQTKTSVVTSKSRLAPLKHSTIPRLELCAIALASELTHRVQEIMGLQAVPVFGWSDSKIALSWLRRPEHELMQYVANRVYKAKGSMNPSRWQHVSGVENPADLVSRGLAPTELMDNRLWWSGPEWLVAAPKRWPNAKIELTTDEQLAIRKEVRKSNEEESKASRLEQKAAIQAGAYAAETITLRFSRFRRLVRVVAYMRRWLPARCQGKSKRTSTGVELTTSELEAARIQLIREEQRRFFALELRVLQSKAQGDDAADVMRNSSLRTLTPRADENGCLRVDGRLKHAQSAYVSGDPLIIPGSSRLAILIVQDAHEKTMHGGTQVMMAFIRREYWITGLRRVVRTYNARCVKCTRYRQKLMMQQMAPLPVDRVTPARAFQNTGLDFAGPILVRRTKANKRTLEKRYVAVFVCMVTKAVHLELAEDLSSAAFIDTFLRFTSIRGHCARLWSDNGTNFVGAQKEIGTMLASWKHTSLFAQVAERGTEWRFITPAAPHQGGLWEAAVRSMKHHLRRVVGAQVLTAEGLITVLAQIGAVLNSRPLSALSDDPEDLQAITPAHFLLGEALVQPCGTRQEQVPANRRKYFEQRQAMAQHFWQRWNQEYLHQLQNRPKWQQTRENLKVGDLVLIKNETTAPTIWPLARVIAVHPGKDGLVRNATLKTAVGESCRPVQKLARLPIKEVEENFEGAGCSAVRAHCPDRESIETRSAHVNQPCEATRQIGGESTHTKTAKNREQHKRRAGRHTPTQRATVNQDEKKRKSQSLDNKRSKRTKRKKL